MSLLRRRVRTRKLWVLLAGLLLIAGWQVSFGHMPPSAFDGSRKVTASVGIQTEPRFFYFLYHLGLYPVASATPPKVDSHAEAVRILRQEPKTLYQDFGLTFASGERGRTYLYWVDALLRGNRIDPALRPAHALAFGLALAGLFASFWWIGRPLFGGFLVALLGSNPFQLYAIHGQDNVFSWSITAMIVLLALHVPLLGPGRKSLRLVLGVAVATGLFMAVVRHVRSEPTPMLIAPILVYATLSRAKLRERIVAVVLCLGVLVVGEGLVAKRLESKLHTAQRAIATAGGVPYNGPLVLHHEFWHPVFCGLGDFDTTHGYAWDDRVAYRYALGVAEKRAGKQLDYNPTFWAQKRSYDGGGRYPIPFFEDLPGYHDIVREKVLRDIKSEPGWYLGILAKRTQRILTETTPVALNVAGKSFAFASPWLGPAAVALLLVLLAMRRWGDAKLLFFAAPLSAPALIVYSDRGMTSYTSFHVVGVAVAIAVAVDVVRRQLSGRSVRSEAH